MFLIKSEITFSFYQFKDVDQNIVFSTGLLLNVIIFSGKKKKGEKKPLLIQTLTITIAKAPE